MGPLLRISPLEGQPLGAEVTGIDLQTAELTDELVATLKKALLDHLVVVIRGQQHVTPARQDALSRRFGELYPHIMDQYRLHDLPGVHVVSNEEKDGRRIGVDGTQTEHGTVYYWHSDLSYMEAPPAGSILHIVVCPPPEAQGNVTYFANMYSAYDSLDASLKQKIRTLQATHVYTNRRPKDASGRAVGLTERQASAVSEVVHPVVRTHPETLRDCLFVSAGFTRAVLGLAPGESEALLQGLHKHATSPAHVYGHHWQPGDMVLWDNRCTIHRASGSSHPRTLHRTTIQGDRPFLLDRSE